MKAEQKDHLPFLYTSDTRPASPVISKQQSFQEKLASSFTEILQLHENNRSVLYLESILQRASSIAASHVYIEPEETVLRIRYRTSERLTEEIISTNLDIFDIEELLAALYGSLDRHLSFEAAGIIKAHFGNIDYELTIMPIRTAWGLSLTIALKKAVKFAQTLDELEIPNFTLKQLRNKLEAKSGLILIAGPAASGKQITRLAVLQELNTPDSKIISAENHPSIQIPRICHVPIHPSANRSESFAEYLLQQSPDICSIDNLNHSKLVVPLVNATISNRLLVATTDARNAIDTLEQLKALGCSKHILAHSLKAILTQRELPKVCSNCKRVHHLGSTDRNWIQQHFPGNGFAEGKFTVGEGCDACSNTGVSGSCKIYELVQGSEDLSEAILEGSRASLATAISLRSNFQTLKQKAFSLALNGTIPLQQVMLIT